jgi:HK97 gp10 family phage protein
MATETFKLTGADTLLATLQQMPAEIVSKNGGPVKLALKKGAYVIANRAKEVLEINTADIDLNGENLSTGFLKQNIIVSRGRGKGLGGSKGEVYLVRIKRKLYEGTRKKKISTTKVARFLEYGTSDFAAEPFLRVAFDQKKQEAVRVTITDLKDRIDKITKKLMKQNMSKG